MEMDMTLNARPKSPPRVEAAFKAMKPGPIYTNGVLIGNWVEDRIECPKQGTLYLAPKEEIDYKKMKPESRHSDFGQNKLNGLQGSMHAIVKNDSHSFCDNYATTADIVYRHLPKPLCGPEQRYYRRCKHIYYPQPDLMECFGNITEWGLRKYYQHEWKCNNVSDYMTTLYEDTFVPPRPNEYLNRCERKGRDQSFTRTFRFKMTKSK